MLVPMTGPQKWIGRLALLGIGLGIGGVVISRFEAQYRVHETEISTRPVFDPPGLKYAQVIAPERSAIRGWVVGMAPPAPSPDRKRVLAVGDSLTWGLGVQVNQAWPAELQRALSGVDVHNLGMCGYDAEQGISLITHHLEAWKPDLVIWANYTNDVDPTFLMFGAHDEHPVFVGSNIPEPARMAPEWLSLWLVRNSAMFRSIQAAKLARVLSSGHTPTAPAGWYEAQVTALKQWTKTTDIPVLVLTLPDHTQAGPERCTEFIAEKDCKDQQESYARIIETVGRSGLPWVDGQLIYAASGQPHFMGADRDTGHPTPEGHRVLAQGLVTVVQNTLAQTN
jgi:lysophospholipase L1-like esterase